MPGAPLPPQAYDSRPEVAKGHPKLLTESGCEGNVCRSACFSLAGNSKERVSNCFVRRPLCAPASTGPCETSERAATICTAHRNFLDTMLWDISIDPRSTTCLPSSDNATAEQKQEPKLKLRRSIQ